MGIDANFMGFLITLFPECFSSTIPKDSNEFDTLVIESAHFLVGSLMGYQNSREKGANLTIEGIALKFGKYLQSILNDKNKLFKIKKGIIVTMDQPFSTPHNKGIEQISRDKKSSIQSHPLQTSTSQQQQQEDSDTSSSFLNKEEYDKLRKKKSLKDGDVFFFNPKEVITLDQKILRRDSKLRWLLDKTFATQLFRMSVPLDKFVLIDEAVFITDEAYKEERNRKVAEFFLQHESDYIKDSFMSLQIHNYYTKALLTYNTPSQSQVTFLPGTTIGESDIKIMSYLKRGEDILIASPDSDVIVATLLHLKGLLNPETFEFDNKIFIDTQTRVDFSSNISRPYRFVNIIMLFEKIIYFFRKEEFTNIAFPIETLCFLFHSYHSDYVQSMNNSCGPAMIWNYFSMIHSTNKDGSYITFPTVEQMKKNREILCSGGKPQRKQIPVSYKISNILGILNKAIYIDPSNIEFNKSYSHSQSQSASVSASPSPSTSPLSPENQSINKINHFIEQKNGFFCCNFYIDIDLDAFTTFYYIIYQQKCIKLLQQEKIITTKVDFIINLSELFINIRNLSSMSVSDPPRTSKPINYTNNNKSYHKTHNITFIIDDNKNKKETLIESITPSTTTTAKKQKNSNNNDILPSIKEVQARLQRITWTLNYYQNGWKDSYKCVHDFAEHNQNGSNLSIHGWKQIEMQYENDLNTPFTSMYYCPILNSRWKQTMNNNNSRGNNNTVSALKKDSSSPLIHPTNTLSNIYKMYTIETTDNIYNKSYFKNIMDSM
jgi:hypothetical protein